MISNNIKFQYYNIELSRHAFLRALSRKIHPDIIESTIKTGKVTRYAKNHIRFEKKYQKTIIVCIGEIQGLKIKIITITRTKRK